MPTEQVSETLSRDQNGRRTILSPVAYSEIVMPSLKLARSSRWVRTFAKFLSLGFVSMIFLMAIAPWQQSVSGTGNVIAFAPLERQQILEAPIKGRIVRWGDEIHENARVLKGQLIAEIQDLDESYSGRLEQQLQNSEQAVAAARQQLQSNERALEMIKTIVESYQSQLSAYKRVKEETVASQDAFISSAEEKVRAEQHQLAVYQSAIPQLQAEFDRTKTLESEGNLSLQKFQEVERKLLEAQAKARQAEAYVEIAEADLEGKTRERSAKIEKAEVDVNYATAILQKAEADVSKAEADIAKSRQELNKAEKEVLEMQVKVSRQENQNVIAPFDGFVVQITPNAGTQVLKEGDPICTIVPDTRDRAVQVWLDGNDASLVEPGRHVRLQFEGWPAVQFAGWPSVAVGTFGGNVVSVDATDNGKGKFRILVQPDGTDMPWPDDRFLRQGVRANAWVLLNTVPLWYETWRRLNGFPPVVSFEDSPSGNKESKPPKIPK